MSQIREPAVADYFYPSASDELTSAVDAYLDAVPPAAAGPAPKALIVPHAGYLYSGPVAATAYARLSTARESVRRVVLMGPCHRIPVNGLALSSADFFRTPLGDIPIEHVSAATMSLPGVLVSDRAHQSEHSLEVHLPFLQRVLDAFTLIPVAVGEATPEHVAGLLDALWGGPETLIVISSDLSHYLRYDEAVVTDRGTCTAIERLDPDAIGPEDACGCFAIRGLLLQAKRRGLRVTTVDLRNSGDTAGARGQVVGYGAWTLGK